MNFSKPLHVCTMLGLVASFGQELRGEAVSVREVEIEKGRVYKIYAADSRLCPKNQEISSECFKGLLTQIREAASRVCKTKDVFAFIETDSTKFKDTGEISQNAVCYLDECSLQGGASYEGPMVPGYSPQIKISINNNGRKVCDQLSLKLEYGKKIYSKSLDFVVRPGETRNHVLLVPDLPSTSDKIEKEIYVESNTKPKKRTNSNISKFTYAAPTKKSGLYCDAMLEDATIEKTAEKNFTIQVKVRNIGKKICKNLTLKTSSWNKPQMEGVRELSPNQDVIFRFDLTDYNIQSGSELAIDLPVKEDLNLLNNLTYVSMIDKFVERREKPTLLSEMKGSGDVVKIMLTKQLVENLSINRVYFPPFLSGENVDKETRSGAGKIEFNVPLYHDVVEKLEIRHQRPRLYAANPANYITEHPRMCPLR